MPEFKLVQSDEILITPTGLATVGKLLATTSLKECLNIKEENVSLLKTVDLNFNTCYENNIPLDLDDSPFDNSDTHKEGINRTYKGFDGYTPSFSYLGTKSYLVNTKLKEGKAHSMRGAKEFLSQSIDNAKTLTDKDILVQIDAGYDSKDILEICQDKGVNFIIKRDLRNNNSATIIKIKSLKNVMRKEK